jgi:hypothetical protein
MTIQSEVGMSLPIPTMLLRGQGGATINISFSAGSSRQASKSLIVWGVGNKGANASGSVFRVCLIFYVCFKEVAFPCL